MGIWNSPLIEVAVGLVLLYLVVAIICTGATEAVSQAFNLRSEVLWATIRNLLGDPEGTGIAKDVYNNPILKALAPASVSQDTADPHLRTKPSYIPGNAFASALFDEIGKLGDASDQAQIISGAPDLLAISRSDKVAISPELKTALSAILGDLDSNVDQTLPEAKKRIANWYEMATDRASGWYKKEVQVIVFGIAFLICFVANADTISVASSLYANPSEREVVMQEAHALSLYSDVQDSQFIIGKSGAVPEKGQPVLAAASDLLGWNGPFNPKEATYNHNDPRRFPNGFFEWLLKLIGLCLTAIAASLGAPFWFDILSRFMNVRSTGPGSRGKDTSTEGSAKSPN